MQSRRFFFLLAAFLTLSKISEGQLFHTQRSGSFLVMGDTISVDSLSLIPGSVILKTSTGILDTSFYRVQMGTGNIILQKEIPDQKIEISYRVFPYDFSKEYYRKEYSVVAPDGSGRVNPFTYRPTEKNNDPFNMGTLNKSGSISRGISMGNNQDLSLNSNLDLRLSGKLNEDLNITLAATDNNIPIQPDGNTQQLQDFDQVYIQLYNDDIKLTAGDFQLARPKSYFMNFYKRAQGLSVDYRHPSNKKMQVRSTASGAISRGKFARNVIMGIESNQGPYRLRGAENETFIIVLAGTEKVYIDGKLLARGQENDYTINYNTAEITFTPKQLITKDKRITVEFQYSDKNYARSLFHVGNEIATEKLNVQFNIYSEQDSKNQPLQQQLSEDEKQLLHAVGDTLSLAISPSIDSVEFSSNEVLYKKVDSLGSSIYVYSTAPDSAFYRLSFSYVGENAGNYIQVNSSANGKVYQWVQPVGGVPQGNYEPVRVLIAPKKNQMFTLSADYQLSKNALLKMEGALTKNDINTFSPYNTNDNTGYGLKLDLRNKFPNKKDSTWNFVHDVNYEHVSHYFKRVERFRSIEFSRDWNRGLNSSVINADQHIVGAGIGTSKKNVGNLHYHFDAFFEGNEYSAKKHKANTSFDKNGFHLDMNANLLNSLSNSQNTDFFRHKINFHKRFRWFTIGYKDEFEDNRFYNNGNDTLASNSYKFWAWEVYAQNPDTFKNRYKLYYQNRKDHAASYTLTPTALAENIGLEFQLLKRRNSILKNNIAYRRLQILDTTLINQQNDENLVNRTEYNLRLWKGSISLNTFYEIGSGLELKKEFVYIEVPTGQGLYTWNDYNGNGVQELDEFEIAQFPDQARYIRVFTPSNEYIKTYNNQFSEVLNINPATVWGREKKNLKKLLSRFSNQTAYRVDRKTTNGDAAIALNPFLSFEEDTALVSLNSSLRNTFYFNRNNSVFSVLYTFQDISNRTLLSNGVDTRDHEYQEVEGRLTMKKIWNLKVRARQGNKANFSEFFSSRDYEIAYEEVAPTFSYQPNTRFRLSALYEFTQKQNAADYGGQQATHQSYGLEMKHNVSNKGTVNLKANYIQIAYDGENNSALSFEMLDALKVGQNITWSVSFQRRIAKNMQLNVTYDGRNSEGNATIHSGNAQIRAFF